MVNYCQNEGVNSFFVVEAEMDSVNSYEIDMLYNNFVEGAGVQVDRRQNAPL